jgi:hypothetical protein
MRLAAGWLRGIPVAALFAAGVAHGGDVSFQTDLMPVLNERCVMCHLEGAQQANFSLYPEAWSQLVGVTSTESPMKRVEPGKPDQSYLYRKLMGTHLEAGGSGARMPFQQDPLDPAFLALLRQWIEQGAKQN